MLTADQRIRITIGDLVVQLQAAHARIEELETQLKLPETGASISMPQGNGRDSETMIAR